MRKPHTAARNEPWTMDQRQNYLNSHNSEVIVFMKAIYGMECVACVIISYVGIQQCLPRVRVKYEMGHGNWEI